MKNAILFLSFLLLFSLSEMSAQNEPSLRLSYDFPAAAWESEALPLGNGNLAGMLFGGVPIDVIQVNEESLWSGGPGKNPNYNGGHKGTSAQAKQNLQNARTALQEKMTTFTNNSSAYLDGDGKVVASNYPAESAQLKANIEGLMGTKDDFGSYQSLANINIAYTSVTDPSVVEIQGNCNNPSNAGEKFPSLFDNSVNTKWYADTGFKGFPCFIAWKYNAPFSVSSYTLTSANDMPVRDPKAWNFYGSNDGVEYTLIDSRSNITFSGRQQSRQFNLEKAETYTHFKLEILQLAGTDSPQLAEISLKNANSDQFPAYTNYLRELDIENAVSTITYTQEGVNYKREYFISHPDNVIAIRLSADKPGVLSRNIRLTTLQTKSTITSAENTITLEGQPADHGANGLKFAQQLKVIPTGGSLRSENGQIIVEDADEILILSSAATNYLQCMDDTYNYFSAQTPLAAVKDALDKASAKSYNELLEGHVADYKSLFDRMTLSLSSAKNTNNKTTDRLLLDAKSNKNSIEENLYLQQLYYQFGRYLLISSSRKNSLPANLQGKWAEGLAPPWSADYHTNINLQMNYWLAEQTNLADCHLPVMDYVKSLVPRGTSTAQFYYSKQDGGPVRGWVIHHENNIWGNTAPGNWYEGFYFPAAAAWMCQDIWEHYQFNRDKAFLEEYYPIILDAALFWVDNLWRDSRDGTLVANPSYSPEHGPYSLGASCDQAIIAELFDFVLKASDILGKESPETNEIKEARLKLAGPQIGLAKQFMEWKDETRLDITGDNQHRHANHLFWLHPGSQIVTGRSAQDDLFAEAMKTTLNTRGDGGTGWSKAWKINFWARLHDGNRSYKLVQELLKESTLKNLFDTHPPFQIDGNFGATAGMTEMLIQSQGDAIELLPALPDAWSEGSFKGIKARGNFELDAEWKNGKLLRLRIKSNSGSLCTLQYPGLSDFSIQVENASAPSVETIGSDQLTFSTDKDGIYILTSQDITEIGLTPEVKPFRVYPTQSKAGEPVTLDIYSTFTDANYQIFDFIGRSIARGKIESERTVLPSFASKGNYIINVRIDDRNYNQKIIKH